MRTLNERIKKVRKSLDLTQQEFADKLNIKRNTVATYETGKSNPSDAAVVLICKTFNVSEAWLRTGEGEIFLPKEEDALDELAKQRGLTRSDCILIEKFLDLKPASRQAVMEYMKRVVSALSDDESAAALPAAPVFAPAPPDTGGQERSAPDLAAKVADLERQNDELAAKVAVMEEENALSGLTGVTSPSPSVSVGNFSPAQKAKK